MTLKEAKLKYLKNRTEATYHDFCYALQNSDIYLLMIWNFTPEEEENIENTDIGDTVHIESQMVPMIAGYDSEKPVIVIYSDKSEIPNNLSNRLAIMQCDSKYLLGIYKAYKKLLRKNLRIVLDLHTDPIVFDDEELIHSEKND